MAQVLVPDSSEFTFHEDCDLAVTTFFVVIVCEVDSFQFEANLLVEVDSWDVCVLGLAYDIRYPATRPASVSASINRRPVPLCLWVADA